MARTQKFTEELLLEAVIRYSEQYKGKIKATELAEWSRKNVEGLEDVRDYHFMRPIRVPDEKTGELKEVQKPCTVRIEELNKSRSITAAANANIVLKASSIDSFFEQPIQAQKKAILETREMFDRLTTQNINLRKENEALRKVRKSQDNGLSELTEKVKDIAKKQDKLIKQINYLMKATDETQRKEALSKMGVSDGKVDLKKYNDSLTLDINEVLDIHKEIIKNANNSINSSETLQHSDNLSNDVLKGIDF